jgi:rSAM/selenodomain-associated transferase 1
MIFTKNPELGKVKSRLAAQIGKVAALEVYNFMLERCRDMSVGRNADKQVWYTERIEKDDIWDNDLYDKQLQEGSDLGARMSNAFNKSFQEGYDKVLIVGSDIPDLTARDIDKAFGLLDRYDAVVGPAIDGGYYLLGLRAHMPQLFVNKNWGTPSVLADTLADLFDVKYALLEQKTDIDYLEDLDKSPAMKNFSEKLKSKHI